MQIRARDTLGGRPAWSPNSEKVAVCVGKEVLLADRQGELCGQLGGGSWSMQPNFSPDGDKVAYACYQPRPGQETSDWTLCEANSDGSDAQILSSNLGWSPLYSKDGQKLIFTGMTGNDYRTYLFDRKSGSERPISFDGGFEIRHDLHPDGERIAYESGRGGYKIMLNRLDFPVEVPLDPADAWYHHQQNPVFAPDGQSLLYERGPDVGDTDLWRGHLSPQRTESWLTAPGDQIEPHFHPNGQWVAFASNHNGQDYDILAARLGQAGEVAELRRVSAELGDEYAPVFSPDGSKLAFRTHNDQDGEWYRVIDFRPEELPIEELSFNNTATQETLRQPQKSPQSL